MIDEYTLHHLAEHLFLARRFDDLYALVENSAWYTAKRDFDVSHRSYLQDVSYAFRAAEAEGSAGLARLPAYTLAQATLGTLARSIFLSISEILVQTGRLQTVLDYVDLIPDPLERAHAFRTIGETLAVGGEQVRAVEILSYALDAAEEIGDGAARTGAFCEIGGAICQMGLSEQVRQAAARALAAAEAIETGQTAARANALSQVASFLIQIGEREQAREVLTRALRTVQETRVLGDMKEIARNLIALGEYDLAWEAVEEIWESRRGSLLDLRPEEIRRIDSERARMRMKPYQSVAWSEFEKDKASIIGWIASTYARAGVPDRGFQVIDEIGEQEAKARALCQLADGLASAGNLDRAVVVAEGIDYHEARAEALCHIVPRLRGAGDFERAGQALVDALDAAPEIGNRVKRASMLGKIAREFVSLGHVGRALAVIDRAADPETKTEVQKTVALALAEVDRTDRALSIAERVGDETARVESLIAIAEVLAQRGESERARVVLRRAIGSAEETGDSDILFEIARTLSEAGAREEARQMVLRILEPAWSMQTYPTRSKLFGKAAQVLAEAGESDRAVALIREIKSKEVRGETIQELIQTFAQAGDLGRVSDLALALTQLEGCPYSWSTHGLAEKTKHEALTQFAQTAARDGVQDEALRIVQGIGHQDSRAEALKAIGRASVQAGSANWVLEMAETLDWVPPSDLLLESVDTLAGQGALERALAVSGKLSQASGQVSALSTIAPALAEAQGPQRASRLLHRAGSIARRIEWESSRDKALGQVARAWAELRDYEQALAVAAAIKEPQAKALAYCRLALILGRPDSRHEEGRPKRRGIRARLRAVWQGVLDERGALTGRADADVPSLQVFPLLCTALTELGQWDYTTDVEGLIEIGSTLQEVGRLGELLSAAERIDDREVRAKALTVIAVAFLQDGDHSRAAEIFSRAIPALGELEQIETLYSPNKMIERRPYQWTRDGILLTMIQAGEQERSAKVLSCAFAAIRGIHAWLDSGNELLEHIGLAFVAMGEYSAALEAAERAEDRGCKSKIAHSAARALAQEGDLDRARAMVEDDEGRIEDSGWRVIAEGLVRRGDFEQALTMIDNIGRARARAEALATAAVAIAQKGRLDYAMDVTAQIEAGEAKEKAAVGVAQALAVGPSSDEVTTAAICTQIVRILHEAGAESRARAWTYVGALAPALAELGGAGLLLDTWRHVETIEDVIGISGI